MDYTRGTDVTSALKYMYQNKYGLDSSVFANCHNIHDVVYAAEMAQMSETAPDFAGGSIAETFNRMGDYYKNLSGESDVTPDNPDVPVTPDNPETPDNPDVPVTPDNPETPADPDNQEPIDNDNPDDQDPGTIE